MVINRSVEEVFSYIENGHNTSNYISKEFQIKPVLSVGSQDANYRMGSQVVGQGAFAGMAVNIQYQVAVFQPNRHIRLKSVGGLYESEVNWQLESQGDNRTSLLLEVKVKPKFSLGVMGSMFDKVVGPLIKQILTQSLSKLKYIMERQPVAVAA